MIRALLSRVAAFFGRRTLDARLEEEVRAHIDLLAADYERQGMTRDDACLAARRAFGAIEPMKERYRDRRSLRWIDDLARDVRHGLRSQRRQPGLAATAIVTLTLGIGANTALFTVIDALLLEPLPVDEPERLRLVTVVRADPAAPETSFSYPVYTDFRERVSAFSSVVLFGRVNRMRMVAPGSGGAASASEPILTQAVSGNFFAALGVGPAVGRVFGEVDDQPGAGVVAVLSERYWARRFARDPSVIGRSLVVNDVPFTVVGVAPREFTGVEVGVQAELWWPVRASLPPLMPADSFALRALRQWRVIGRLRPGVDSAQAEAQAGAVIEMDEADRMARDAARLGRPLSNDERARIRGGRVRLEPAGAGFTRLRWQFQRPLLVLMTVVALVLLIACANVASLLLARAAARERELAVRMALGSGRGRLVRQLLVESALLAAAGGTLGIGVAVLGGRIVAAFLQTEQIAIAVSPNPRMLVFTAAVTLLAALIAGSIPAVLATRLDLVRRDAKSAVPRLTARHTLVAAQVALSVVVVVVAGLFVRTLVGLERLEIGFDPDGLTTVSLDMPPRLDGAARLAAYRALLERLDAVPDHRAAISLFGMLSGAGWTTRVIPDRTLSAGENPIASAVIVSSQFFPVTGMRIVDGRPFGPADDASPTRTAVVNETAARLFFGASAIGRRFSMPDALPGGSFEVIGVVADSMYRSVRDEAEAVPATVFLPALQAPGAAMLAQFNVELQLRTRAGALAEPVIRSIVRDVHPEILVTAVRPMRTIIDATMARERLLAQLAGWLAVVSIVLGAIGIYGVRSYAVSRRAGEIGVRLALGATPRHVAGRIVCEGAAVAAVGIAAGIVAAVFATRVVEGLLFGVTPLDAPTFVATAGLFAGMAAAASSYLPARKATRIEPVHALRSE